MVGGGPAVEYHPLPSDDPTQRQPKIDQARDVLGWTPKVEVDEGLARTIEYFRKQLALTAVG